MRISYEWLGSMVDLPEDPQVLYRELIRTGTEVETIERVGENLDHVVTGKVLSKEKHPDSDHMWVTKVDVGEQNLGEDGKPEPLQIVCGAQNFNEGDHIVVAMIGAVLPGDVKIKKSKLRGIMSCGMNCSERELGLGNDHDGIMILPKDAPIGMPFSQYQGTSDIVLDCEITPNRPDCLSYVGMATEVGAVLDEDTHIELPAIQKEQGPKSADLVDVKVDPELCTRYVARVVRGVKIGPSPEWLARRVIAAGSRPINNVVDVTNYVMYLTGQPLHAFDLGKLSERDGKRHIVVRAASQGEKLTTLDSQERVLDSNMAVITDDGETPVALAGVMGGLNSEIDDTTVDVLLESAVFDKSHISRTSRNLNLMSEASIRYERQVDPANCEEVSDIAAALFESCCGATVCQGRVDEYPVPVEAARITMRPERIRALCGAPITDAEQIHLLERLGCAIVGKAGDEQLTVVAPTNRPDLTREADLCEEVLRLWGMDRVEATLPAAKNHAGGLTVDQQRTHLIGETLRACGLSETFTYCFAEAGDMERTKLTEVGRGVPVRIMNPLLADQSEMRRSILPGLLRSVAYNLDHGVENVALYEQGRCFFGHENRTLPDEPRYVAAVLSGSWNEDGWNTKSGAIDFFDGKGVIERLLAALRITKVRFKVADPEKYPWLQPGRAAEVFAGPECLGWVGNVHPLALANFGIEADVVAFELEEARLLKLAHRELPYQDVPTLPAVEHDLAIVVDEDVTAETLQQRLTSAGGKLLESAQLFDVYRDPVRVGFGKKSMAFKLTYRAADRTLTGEEVEKAHEKLVTKVCRAVNGEVRG